MRHMVLCLPALVVMAGCGASGPAGNNQAAANMAGSAAGPGNVAVTSNGRSIPGPLFAHVGRLPSDVVNGTTFLADPRVRAAVEAAVADPEVRRWVLREDVTSTPIGSQGGRIIATGCEAHNCGPHHWSIVIDTEGTGAEVCYARNSTLERSTWYVAGRPVEERAGDCPASEG